MSDHRWCRHGVSINNYCDKCGTGRAMPLHITEEGEEIIRLRALTQQQAEQHASLLDVYRQNMQLVSEQAEQIAELVEYAKGMRGALDLARLTLANYFEATRHLPLDPIDGKVPEALSDALAKPMPKGMQDEKQV